MFLASQQLDQFIDYTTAPLVEQLISNPPSPKFHAIFDAVGLTDPSLYLNSALYLAPGGAFSWVGDIPKTRKEIAGVLRQAFEGLLRPAWLRGVPRKWRFVYHFSVLAPTECLDSVVVVNLGKKELETVSDLVAKGSFLFYCYSAFVQQLRRLYQTHRGLGAFVRPGGCNDSV
jgi:hypothetical protein